MQKKLSGMREKHTFENSHCVFFIGVPDHSVINVFLILWLIHADTTFRHKYIYIFLIEHVVDTLT